MIKLKNFEINARLNSLLTGTGKSLFQTVWMRVCNGETKPTLTSITEAVAYETLANGDNIYGNI